MKLIMNRLLVLSAAISIVVIFYPILMEKSNRQFEGDAHISVRLPSRPAQPDVAIADKNTLFKTVKVAHVDIPEVPNVLPTMTIAKAESLGPMNENKPELAKTVIPVLAELQLHKINKE